MQVRLWKRSNKKSANLLNGKSKSCGCLREEIGNNPFEFEIGQEIETKYGKFVVKNRIREEREITKIRDKKYICKCQNCGEENTILEHTLTSGMGSCRACSDSRSFGERFFYWFLKQNNIDFITEYSPKWMGRKRFDFYFSKNGINYIVEIDGSQHYTRSHKRLTAEEVIKIDKEKQKIAEEKGLKVIRINCEKSKGKYIVESIKNSELSKIFDLKITDWNKCFYMSVSNKMKRVSDLWNKGHNSTKEISEITGYNQNYISKLLIECADFGICEYNPKEESYKGSLQSTNGKKIICKNNGKIYESASECSRKSEKDLGVCLTSGGITRVCRNERKHYKGFNFEYIE